MVLSSVQICMDSDWPQSVMHERTLKPLEEILPACSRPMVEQSGLKPPPPDQALKCPRCDSTNTKFCYYNNYSLSQPRHFCKACKRYWTRGGTLRNVPVGGGCRKNKRAKRTIDHACVQMNDASTSVNDLNINGSAPLGHSQITNSMFYGLNPTSSTATHDGIHSLSLATRLADQRALYGSDSEFLRTFFDPRSCNLSALTGRSSLNSLNGYKSTFPGLNFDSNPSRTEALTRTVRDLDGSFFESLPTQISEVSLPVLNSTNCDHLSPFALSLQEGINANTNSYSEANQWRPIEQQKLAEVSDHVQVGLTPFAELENSNSTKNDPNLKVVTSLPSCVKVEGQDIRLNITSEWPAPSEPLFEAASDSAYWNAGVWPELNTYGSSVGSLI